MLEEFQWAQGYLLSTLKELLFKLQDSIPALRNSSDASIRNVVQEILGVKLMRLTIKPSKSDLGEYRNQKDGIAKLLVDLVKSNITLIAFDKSSF